MIVFPRTSIAVAPAGALMVPRGPAATIRVPCTSTAESVIGAARSPVMSRAPSNSTAPEPAFCAARLAASAQTTAVIEPTRNSVMAAAFSCESLRKSRHHFCAVAADTEGDNRSSSGHVFSPFERIMRSRWNVDPKWWVAGALSACLILAASQSAGAADWPVIAPADLTLAKPRIDPNTDAEVLLWDVRLTDSDERDQLQTILEHHLRIKIFTDRGREAHSKVDITYTRDARVRDIEGRTVSPAGVVTELRDKDIFDRTVIEANGITLKAKSFVLPAAAPGSVIEYRWREIRDD